MNCSPALNKPLRTYEQAQRDVQLAVLKILAARLRQRHRDMHNHVTYADKHGLREMAFYSWHEVDEVRKEADAVAWALRELER